MRVRNVVVLSVDCCDECFVLILYLGGMNLLSLPLRSGVGTALGLLVDCIALRKPQC